MKRLPQLPGLPLGLLLIATLVPVLLLSACGRSSGGGRTLIQNKGSDTLVNVAQAWAEAYKEVHPNVAVAVSGGGSGTGISALINGTVDLANSSREIKDKELEQAQAAGADPREFLVGYDALAIFLHPDNPIDRFRLDQLAEIYGEGGEIETWDQLGVQVPGCDSGEIVRISRQNNSGTYVYFQEAVLGERRDFKLGSRDMHGSKDVVDLVQHTPCAIGYSGLAYATEGVKVPCIEAAGAATEADTAEGADGAATPESATPVCVAPTVETAVDGSYPIARPLFMYTRGEPEGEVKAYLDWILSDEGQCIIEAKGYAPVRDVSCS